MNDEDYSKLRYEMMGALMCSTAGDKASIQQALLVVHDKAPEMMPANQMYHFVGDTPFEIVGRLVDKLLKSIEFKEKDDGTFSANVSMVWKQ